MLVPDQCLGDIAGCRRRGIPFRGTEAWCVRGCLAAKRRTGGLQGRTPVVGDCASAIPKQAFTEVGDGLHLKFRLKVPARCVYSAQDFCGDGQDPSPPTRRNLAHPAARQSRVAGIGLPPQPAGTRGRGRGATPRWGR